MISEFRSERKKLEDLVKKGVADDALLHGYSRIVDGFIRTCFGKAEIDLYRENVALVALGGYGRKEFFPFSDIDLMILYRPAIKKHISVVADAILYPLWDTGLEVGHGVRTVSESIKHAREEYFFLVALLDARLVCGSSALFDELVFTYRKKFIDGHRESFVKKMKEHRESRRERFGSHSYLLEPHIKEGRGGMRDIQAMMWTASVVFGLKSLDDIHAAGLLVESEVHDFLEGRAMVNRLRSQLHLLGGRKSDQLYFEHQADLAELFGYKSDDGLRGVERFMRDVYGALRAVSVITDLFFDHVDEVLGLAAKRQVIADKVIEKGIEIKNGRVHLTVGRSQLLAKPLMLIRVFLAMSRTGLPMHHRTRKLVSSSLDLITDKMRTSPRTSKTFFVLLIEAKDLFAVLETMMETGVLAAYVPEFSRIDTLAQHDLYHIYTVDRHSLQAVEELHQLVKEWENVAHNVKWINVLYLAALLHDIGKGSGRDHSLEGEGVAVQIGRRFGFSQEECDCLGFLVRYHLFMPESALRRDLNDANFIKKCADTIGDVERLSMLYLLSAADSKATGPSAWSDWKATLMEEMYLKIIPYLDHGRHGVLDTAAHEEQGVEWLREQIRVQLEGERDLKIDPETLDGDYVLSFSPQDISSHIVTQRNKYTRIRQKSLIVASESEECWSLLIMTVDRPGLLAKICGVMALNSLTVIKAQIFTWPDGTVVDVIDVRPIDGLSFAEKDWRELNEQLDLAIAHRMGLSHRLYRKLSSGYGRKTLMVGDVAPKVVIDNESSESFSVIETHAEDLPGQLYYITQAMADFGLNIHKAYIATEVEKLIDAFYVLDSNGQKLVAEEFRSEVTQGVLHSLACSGR